MLREATPVRSLVGIITTITTIATVIHFTFGCCLHPCHFGGCVQTATHAVDLIQTATHAVDSMQTATHAVDSMQTATHAVDSESCNACCHDHDDVAGECETSPYGQADHGHPTDGRATITVADHCLGCGGCQGCHCVATSTDAGTTVSWSPLASGIMAALDSHAIVLCAVACGTHPPDPRMHPCPARHALFERFLI